MLVAPRDKRYRGFKRRIKIDGFSPDELWGLDYAILAFILPRLKAYRKNVAGIKLWSDLPDREYRKNLDKIIFAFELYIKRDGWLIEDGDQEKWKEAMDLFVQYFPSFWT
jgi:hypothetical protein